MAVTIYHNPKCGTSRTTLALIREAGIEPTVVEYLKTPPTRAALAALVKRAGAPARAFLRTKEALALELKLEDASEAKILDAMAAHPILINRPIVATPRGVRLCRPPETVREIL
jgi:arsenate reductase